VGYFFFGLGAGGISGTGGVFFISSKLNLDLGDYLKRFSITLPPLFEMSAKVFLEFSWGELVVRVEYFPWGYMWSIPAGPNQPLNTLSDGQFLDVIADLDAIGSHSTPWMYEWYSLEQWGIHKRPIKNITQVN